MTLYYVLIVVTAMNLGLGVLVVWHKPRAEVNRIFAVTTLSIAGWTFTNALFQATRSILVATTAAQLSYLSAIALAASFLHFAWTFPRRSNINDQAKLLLWTLAIGVGSLSFIPGAVIRGIDFAGPRSINTNPGIYAIALFMVVTSLWAFATFVGHLVDLNRVVRTQAHYVLTGSALTAVIGLICNLLFPLLHNYSYVWLGPTSSLFFVGFSVYAIVAHHLFDIRIIIKKSLVYGILLAAIGVGYHIIQSLLTDLLNRTQGDQHPLLANLGGAIIVSFLVDPVRRWLEEQLDRVIFRRRHHR